MDDITQNRPDATAPDTGAGEVRLTAEARAYYLLIPFFVTLGVLALLGLLHGTAYVWQVIGLAATQFALAGKFIVFAGLKKEMAGAGFTPLYLALLVVYMDVLVGSIVMINISVFYRLPFIGKKLDDIQRNSTEILRANPWARKATFLSLMAFVAFPLTGTGAIGGGFFGRMLGLSRKNTFLGLVCGSAFGSGLMLGLALAFGDQLEKLKDNPVSQVVLIVGGIVVIAGFIYVLSKRLKTGLTKTRMLEKAKIEAALNQRTESEAPAENAPETKNDREQITS